MTIYNYDKFVHPVPAGYTLPKGTQMRSVDSAPFVDVETFFTTQYDHPVTPSNDVKYYLTYDITRPKLPEEINSVIYNLRIGVTVFPVAVYQGSRIWSAFSDIGERASIYSPEIESFDLVPPKEETGGGDD